MRPANPFLASIEEWELLLLDRGNTMEIRGHGGGSRLSGLLSAMQQHDDVVAQYEKLVQATLNRWLELASVVREEYEDDPLWLVIGVPFGRHQYFIEDLRPSFERLWKESPRPHSDYHKFMAMNYGAELPVTQFEAELLFQQNGWELAAARLASLKGFSNTAGSMIEQIRSGNIPVKVDDIIHLVKLGFPKLKGFRWLYMLPEGSEYTLAVMTRWRDELLAEGIPESDLLPLPS